MSKHNYMGIEPIKAIYANVRYALHRIPPTFYSRFLV